MNEFLKEYLKTVICAVAIILTIHTVFFIACSYFMTGDAFLALRNFYYMTYNIRI